MTDSMKKILSELCAKHASDDIAADMIELFEDIRKFFLDNDKDCIDFGNLSAEAQEALYVQIKLLISLLKKMKGAADKTAILETISTTMVGLLSKHKEHAVLRELDRHTQKILKQRFADMVLLELYKKYRASKLHKHTKNNHVPHVAKNQLDRTRLMR